MNNSVIEEYMRRVQAVYETGVTTEHSFRAALGYLFDNIDPNVNSINEPKAMREVGRPDFVFKRSVGQSHITLGHCEAKDIDKDVSKKGLKDYSKEQFARYIKGLPNLIYTNGLDFVFYVKGELVRTVSIGDLLIGIQPKPDQYALLTAQLTEFAAERLQTITSAKRLAEMMAGKALMIKEALFQTLRQDPDLNTELAGQYKAFKDQLIHDLTPEGFADIYAETIAYGMFAARLHDDTLEDFSREEALELLPKSNPFLRDLFGYVAGPRLDERIRRDIDELAEIFQATDLQKLFADFGSFTKRNDPFIHFYETFLAEYNPRKRKARGVWYTPEPVVNFIVRAVDDVLKTEFGLPMGLADTSKITVDVDTGQTKTVRGKSKPIMEKREMHRVQILDPATGTGTFLAEVIKQIAPKVKDIAPGKWSRYVEQDLIPRLHGFELLMASYAMCHMKLDMMLSEMGYKPTAQAPRLSVYLTNSLEEGDKEVRDLFMAQWLSNEAKAANEVKRDKPIMCIIGNPPYSVSSSNKGQWISNLIGVYKKGLNERKINLDDDYIKFLRMSEYMIDENGSGIVAMITNNSFLDGITHREMRKSLLTTFDKIHILNLHGDSNKKETAPDGSSDQNVFDIMQGVSIAIFQKSEKSSTSLAKVFSKDIYGKRSIKTDGLWSTNISQIEKDKLDPVSPYFFFTPKNFENREQYESGFLIRDLFNFSSSGIETQRDAAAIHFNIEDLNALVEDFQALEADAIRSKYSLGADGRDWKVEFAKSDLSNYEVVVSTLHFKPFDFRKIPYTGNSKGIIAYPRSDLSNHFLHDNFGIVSPRFFKKKPSYFVTGEITAHKVLSAYDKNFVFPLYLYPVVGELDQTRRVNMDPKIRKAIEIAAESKTKGIPDEVDIFDYIYGVLHSLSYRDKYAEFLKIDFPRVPYPSSPDNFWDISSKGASMRRLHLMEDTEIGETPYPYRGEGNDTVEKPDFEGDDLGMVSINKTQGFSNVPRIAWELYIGGYQPAQKWLKDRKGRELSLEDIMHYRKIIKILSETDRIVKTIEMDL